MASGITNPSVMQEKQVLFLDWEDPLEKGMATTPVFLPEESTDKEAWMATAQRVAKSWTQMSNYTLTIQTNKLDWEKAED